MELTLEKKTRRVRRPRPTSACAGCRDRRIKCDRVKPICLECKRHHRLCDRSKRGGITDQIVLDPHVEMLKTISLSQPTLAIRDEAVLRVGQNEASNEVPSQVLSVSQFSPLTERKIQEKDALISIVASCIPPSRVCDLLLQSFLCNISVLIPVDIDISLLQDVAVSRRTTFAACSPHLLSLILGVIYSGAIASPSVLSFKQMKSLYSVYKKLLETIEPSAISDTASILQLLQGYIVINTSRASRYDPLVGYELLPHAIHLAKSLHLDQESGDYVQKETKRRVWWYLIYLDIESSIGSSRASMICSDSYTTQMPSLTLDSSLWNNAISDCRQHTPAMLIAMHGCLLFAQKLQTWMQKMPCEVEMELEIAEFTRAITSLLQLIPDTPATEWPRLFLSLQEDRARCFLQQEFSPSILNCDDPLLRSARSSLSKYLRLATLRSRPNYQWYLPGLMRPLHALMIVLTHLTICQHLEVESTFSRELIDKIFALRVLHDVGSTTMVTRAIIRKDEKPGPVDDIYCRLWNLRISIWESAGWEIPKDEELSLV